MKQVIRHFKGHKHLCFLDFEGTQFSHEMIAYGAVLVTIDKDGKIVKQKPAIKRYVKCKNSIGKFVENLTGITRLDLDRFGVPFETAIKDLKKYCGLAFKKCSFLTFGNHDLRILNQSVSYNLDSPKELCNVIRGNYVDIQSIIAEYIRDDKSNPLSLSHYLELFNLEFDGKAHDPQYDAVNLARLYDAFMRDTETVFKEFKKNIARVSFHPVPVQNAVRKLLNGENVSSQEFEEDLKRYLE